MILCRGVPIALLAFTLIGWLSVAICTEMNRYLIKLTFLM